MVLEQLTVRQFRNLAEVTLGWGEGFNVIWGNNAQGKTNLLEAVYLLGHLKSFRGARTGELIRGGATRARVAGRLVSSGVVHHLDVTLEAHGQTPRLDGKPVRVIAPP